MRDIKFLEGGTIREAGARGVMVPRGRGGRASTNLESVNGPNGAIARQ